MRSKLFISLFGVLSQFFLYSCTTGDSVVFDPNRRAATAPEAIEVVYSNTLRRPHKVIGIVSANTYSMESALRRMRYDASEMGADALLDFGPNGSQTSVGANNGYLSNFGNPYFINTMQTSVSTSYNTGFSAKAIVWEENDTPPADKTKGGVAVSDTSKMSLKQNLSILPDEYKNSILDVYAECYNSPSLVWDISLKSNKKGYRRLNISDRLITSDYRKLVLINRSKPFSIDLIKIDSTDVFKILNNLPSVKHKQISYIYLDLRLHGKFKSPLWTIWLYGPNDYYHGEIKIDSETGNIISNNLS